MSASGQKPTRRRDHGISALPLKADIILSMALVRFVPNYDMTADRVMFVR
jgi:hypothetical protein